MPAQHLGTEDPGRNCRIAGIEKGLQGCRIGSTVVVQHPNPIDYLSGRFLRRRFIVVVIARGLGVPGIVIDVTGCR